MTVRKKVRDSGIWWVLINHQVRREAKKVGSKKAAKEVAAKSRPDWHQETSTWKRPGWYRPSENWPRTGSK